LDFQRKSSVCGLLGTGPKGQEESGQMSRTWIFVMTCVALSYAGMVSADMMNLIVCTFSAFAKKIAGQTLSSAVVSFDNISIFLHNDRG